MAKIIAEINARMKMTWSYLEMYELQMRNKQTKLQKLQMELEEAEDNLRKVDTIYAVQNNQNFDENRGSLGNKNNVFEDQSNNQKTFEFLGRDFLVEFNYMSNRRYKKRS